MTAKNLLDAVILYMFCFRIGAFPTARKRTTTFEVSFLLWFAITVAGDAGGPVGSGLTPVNESRFRSSAGGDSVEGVPEFDIVEMCDVWVCCVLCAAGKMRTEAEGGGRKGKWC